VENVEFLKGYLEDLPLGDETVEVVISNCVINQSDTSSEPRKVRLRCVLEADMAVALADDRRPKLVESAHHVRGSRTHPSRSLYQKNTRDPGRQMSGQAVQ
jgi:hypothetical protein